MKVEKKMLLKLSEIQHRIMPFSEPMERAIRVEEGTDEEDKKYVFKGSAAVTEMWSNDLGGFKEIIHSNSFAKTIYNRCIATFNHDENLLLGKVTSKTLRLSTTSKGIDVEIDEADTTISRDCKEWVKRGEIDGMSFKFFVAESGSELIYNEKDKIYEHHIHDIQEVLDVSLVVRQAYPNTSIALSRQIDLEGNVKSLEAMVSENEGNKVNDLAKVARALNRRK